MPSHGSPHSNQYVGTDLLDCCSFPTPRPALLAVQPVIPSRLGDVIPALLYVLAATRRAPRSVCEAVDDYPARVARDPRQESIVELLKQEYVLFVVDLHRPLVFTIPGFYSSPQIHTLVVCLGAQAQLLTHKVQLVGYELELLTHGAVQVNAL